MTNREKEERGLTRDRLVEAALGLIQEEGLEGLSMRALADRLEVKAASLYWHVRDRRELIELLAESILETVPSTSRHSSWRGAVIDAAAALGHRVSAQKDAGRIMLEVPDALERSNTFAELNRQLQAAGLQPGEAGEVALTVMVQVITARRPAEGPVLEAGATASIAIDSGSRGVVLRAGFEMETLIRVAAERGAAAPAIVRGETVVVRRLRGVGLGEVELNPRHPWRFKIQGATWNTVLDVGTIDVRDIKLDSGAAKVECFLPKPRGVVPIDISSGVVGVTLHRPPGVAVIADIHSGAVRLKLDDYSIKALISDVRWESQGAAGAADRYEIRINSGVVQLTLDDKATLQPSPHTEPPKASVEKSASALEILLDGVESRVRRSGTS